MKRYLTIFFALLLPLAAMAQALPAFPGAMGGGAMTQGGRGGFVCEVTSLADSGTGTQRDCLTGRGVGPRILIYRVAGCFEIDSQILVTQRYISILAQTAPGEVIEQCSKSTDGMRWSNGGDVIIRSLTWSPDNFNIASGPDTGTLGFYVANTQAQNFITDHTTNRWAGNKPWLMFASWPGPNPAIQYNKDTTMQWSLNYEPHAMHPVGPSTSELDTVSITALSGNIDFIDNWFVNTGHRITEYNHSPIRWINNVTHNYGFYAYLALGATKADLINNVWSIANLQPQWRIPIHSTDGNYAGSNPGTPSFYVSGNIGPDSSTVNANQYGDLARVAVGENVQGEKGSFPASWQRSAAMPLANSQPIPILPATGLAQAQASHIGNSRHLDCLGNWVYHRDPQDLRIVNQVLAKGPGGYWPNAQTQEGPSSIPQPTSDYQDHPVTHDANGNTWQPCVESMHDGVPDQFKQAHGLSLTSQAVIHNIDPATGWPWDEGYWGGLYDSGAPPVIPPVIPPVTPPSSWTAGQAVVVNAKGAGVGHGWDSTFSTQFPIAQGDAGTITTGTVVTHNTFTYIEVLFSSGASSGKKALVGTDWIDPGTAPPPVAVTNVVPLCPATATVGTPFSCTATVQPSTANQAVTWTPTMPDTPTAAGAMTAKATSVADPTKSGSANVMVNVVTPPPNCPVVNGTFTSTVPVAVLVGGVAVPVVTVHFTCNYTFDPNTNSMTVTGCH